MGGKGLDSPVTSKWKSCSLEDLKAWNWSDGSEGLSLDVSNSVAYLVPVH